MRNLLAIAVLFAAGAPLGSLLFGVEGESGARPDGPSFVDIAETAGVAAPHTNRTFQNPYANIMQGYTALGASAAVADYDGDGWEDLYVTDSKADGKNHLYHNNGNRTFTDVAAGRGSQR